MSYGILNDTNTQIATFIAPLTVKSNQPVFSSDTLALSRVSIKRNAQRWEVDANLAPLVGNANDLFAHLVTKGSFETFDILMPQNYGAQSEIVKTITVTATLVRTGDTGVFTLTGPSGYTGYTFLNQELLNVGTITDVTANTFTCSLTSSNLITNAVAQTFSIASEAGLTLAVNVAGTTSLVIAQNLNRKLPAGTFITLPQSTKVYMVTSHTTTLNIFPALRVATTNPTIVTFKNVKMKTRYDTDVISGMVYSDGIMMSTGQVKLIEAL
jgi:hypothetical protein